MFEFLREWSESAWEVEYLGSNKFFRTEGAEWEVGIKNCAEGVENGGLWKSPKKRWSTKNFGAEEGAGKNSIFKVYTPTLALAYFLTIPL